MNLQDVMTAAGFEPAYFLKDSEFRGWKWGSAALVDGSETAQHATSAQNAELFSVWAHVIDPMEERLEALSEFAIALDPLQRSLAIALWGSEKYKSFQVGVLGEVDERVDDAIETLEKLLKGFLRFRPEPWIPFLGGVGVTAGIVGIGYAIYELEK